MDRASRRHRGIVLIFEPVVLRILSQNSKSILWTAASCSTQDMRSCGRLFDATSAPLKRRANNTFIREERMVASMYVAACTLDCYCSAHALQSRFGHLTARLCRFLIGQGRFPCLSTLRNHSDPRPSKHTAKSAYETSVGTLR